MDPGQMEFFQDVALLLRLPGGSERSLLRTEAIRHRDYGEMGSRRGFGRSGCRLEERCKWISPLLMLKNFQSMINNHVHENIFL